MRPRFFHLTVLTTAGLCASSLWASSRAQDGPKPAETRILAAWAAGPFEARVVFDRPVGAEVAKSAVGRTVSFEDSRSRPDERGSLRVAAARLEDAGRTLVLTTDPHPRAAAYTLELEVNPGKPLRVVYDLSGVEATWTGKGAEGPAWKGRWPTFNSNDVQATLRNSPEHARLVPLLARPGKLVLESLVTLPKGSLTLTIAAPAPTESTLNGEASKRLSNAEVFQTESTGEPMILSVSLATSGDRPLTLKATAKGATGPELPLVRKQLLLPWTPASPPPPAPLENIPDLSGGDPRQGALVFASAEAKCSNCHKVRGVGGNVGPDLSALVGRDRKEVYRDIAEPSARIHPDYVPYTIVMKDGRVLVGTVRAEGADTIRVSDTDAKVTALPRAGIEDFRPVATSVMPVGLVGVIGESKLRDLIAYLTTPPAK